MFRNTNIHNPFLLFKKSLNHRILLYICIIMHSYLKNSISLFFLTTFLLLKVVNLHEFSHIASDKDAQHCEQCAFIAQAGQATPLGVPTPQSAISFINPFDFVNHSDSYALYVAPHQKVLHSDYFHNKPPPNPVLG